MECIPCLARQAAEAVSIAVPDATRRPGIFRRVLREIVEADWNQPPPVMAQRIHRLLREETGHDDPYRSLKKRMNELAIDCLASLREMAGEQPDAQEAAVRIAIGGNLLDSGAKTQVRMEDLHTFMSRIFEQPLEGAVHELFEEVDRAARILYLADNAGEIVFDRYLIEQLPRDRVTLAVRGAPVINDATMEDARTAGLDRLVPVITTGSDAPGVVLDQCSEDFLRHFDAADLVIAKGQGNYEALSSTGLAKNIFYLLFVKCPVIARDIGCDTGTLVVRKCFEGSPAKNGGATRGEH